MYDSQILTPSRKSNVGVERLNKIMQDFLNPADAVKQERQVGDVTFREGDKVMQIKNDYQLAWEKRADMVFQQNRERAHLTGIPEL